MGISRTPVVAMGHALHDELVPGSLSVITPWKQEGPSQAYADD